MVFEYFINKDERGEFNADVRNQKGETIFEIDNSEPFEDGFMKHSNDIEGLAEWLIDLQIIPAGSKLVRGN
jgi:hypothetical protein